VSGDGPLRVRHTHIEQYGCDTPQLSVYFGVTHRNGQLVHVGVRGRSVVAGLGEELEDPLPPPVIGQRLHHVVVRVPAEMIRSPSGSALKASAPDQGGRQDANWPR
jgi:hypothetical protein